MGHTHSEMRYNGDVKVAERPVVLCHKAGRYIPMVVCEFCLYYEPVSTTGEEV